MAGRSLRVLFLAPQPFFEVRGTPVAVLHMTRALAALGHTVDLLTSSHGRPAPVEGVRHLRSLRLPVGRVKAGPSLAKMALDVPFLAEAVWMASVSSHPVRYLFDDWLNLIILLGALACVLGTTTDWIALVRVMRVAVAGLVMMRTVTGFRFIFTRRGAPVLVGASFLILLSQPVWKWVPSIAPAGMAFYTGDRFPKWKGDLFVGALKDQMLVRLRMDGEKVVSEERMLKGIGRVRDVRAGPDGYLYLLIDAPDGSLLRIEPAR